MAALMQEYETVYQKIKSYNSRIREFQEEIQKIGSRRDDEIPARIENLKKQLEKIDEYQARIDAFKQLAEKHMISKNLPTIEAPPGYRVNLNRLRGWSMMIDPLAEDDSYAQRVYLVASCDSVFLEQKKVEFQSRIVELDNDYAVGAPDQIKELESKIDALRTELYDYLKGEEFDAFAQRVRRDNEANLYAESPAEYQMSERTPEFWVPGAYGTVLDADEEARKIMKSQLGRFYDEKAGMVYLPIMRISSDEEFAMTVSCVPARKYLGEMDAGIRNLILHMIDQSPVGSRRVYVFDAVRQNSALIGSLKDLEGSYVLPAIPRNAETMQNALEELVASFSDIDDMLDNYDTVIEYNQAVEKDKQIPRALVVIVGWPNAFEGSAKDYVNRIISNYTRYGISFIAVKISAAHDRKNTGESGIGISDYVGEELISITMTAQKSAVRFGHEQEQAFSWYTYKHVLGGNYVEEVKAYKPKSKGGGTEYSKRFDLTENVSYTRGKKNLVLPYGVTSKDEVLSLSFDNENFASYLMGASGSGKSTLLHTLITGIIRNYHPDDVELWLADFKMSEFAQYINPMPPHVKYILLDESQELVFDLIDRLVAKMMERQKFFMKNRTLKKVENVRDIHMPVIFVMLDEFSIMSQAVAESVEYKLKLQNLLAKGRALGIKFLFSSQTFTSGITGLTTTAKAQIQSRIAMKNDKAEITETLELSAAQKTDQVQNWIDALPPHYALVKYREKDQLFVRRVEVLYFAGTSENAYIEQQKLIERINSSMHKVETSQPEYINAYLDKNPVVVDGNSFDIYSQELLEKYITRQKAESENKEDIQLSFGTPRLMSQVKLVSVTPESRENILLLAPLGEQACAASLVFTAMKMFHFQQNEVEVWTYGRNRMFQAYKNGFEESAVIRQDMNEVCGSIRAIKNKIVERKNGNHLIVLLGMERICGDFEFADGVEPIQQKSERTKAGPDPKAVVQTEEDEFRRRFAIAWAKKQKQITEELKKQDIPEQEIKVRVKQEKSAMVKEWEPELIEIRARTKAQEEQAASGEVVQDTDNQEPAEQKEDHQTINETAEGETGAYNALEDLQYLLMHGSRFGYHFLLCLNNFSDLKATRIKLDWFRHRLTFQLSTEESREVFRSKVATQLPEHICQYYDTMEGFSVRPYLHKGIEWDGWGVDEDGQRISPFE